MAKRWFISPVIGTGTKGDSYRPKISGVGWAAMIPSNSDGTPKFDWCLVKVSATDFSNLDSDTQLNGLPVSLSDTVGSLSAAARTKLQTFLTNKGVDLTGITLSSTIRDVLDRVLVVLGGRDADLDTVDLP